jgi:hypothetical protein
MFEETKELNDDAKDRYVGYFDILGFKKALQSLGAPKLASLYQDAIEEAKAAMHGKFDLVMMGQKVGEVEWFEEIEHIVAFSDSIFVFSHHDAPPSLDVLCQFANTIFKMFLVRNLPLRGAIAHGEVVLRPESSLFLGQGIVAAYELAESIDALGVALCPELPQEPPTFASTQHDIPIKVRGQKSKFEKKSLIVPVAGFNTEGTANADWRSIFRSLRQEAGEEHEQRYRNSETIVAAMLNIDSSDLR